MRPQTHIEPHYHRRGAFIGGMLQGVVNAGRSAEKRLSWDKQLTEEDRKELIHNVNEGKRAQASIEAMRKKLGYDNVEEDRKNGDQKINPDEIREIKVHYSSQCLSCKAASQTLWDLTKDRGWKVSLVDVDSYPRTKPDETWGEGPWPYIKVNGLDTSLNRLNELTREQSTMGNRGDEN